MSLENVKEFLKKYKNDYDFKYAIDNAPDINIKRRIAREAGFEFTKKEVEEFSKITKERELEEDELDKVVGGSSSAFLLLEDIKAALDAAF